MHGRNEPRELAWLIGHLIDQGEAADWEQFWAEQLTAWPDQALEQVRVALVMQALDLASLPQIPPDLALIIQEIAGEHLHTAAPDCQEGWDEPTI